MSYEELDRVRVIERVIVKRLTQREAARTASSPGAAARSKAIRLPPSARFGILTIDRSLDGAYRRVR